jgi:hypothetical protein
MKLPSILALIVILFLSLSVVSADEIVQDVTNTSDSVIDDSIGISDSYNNLASNFDDSISDDSSNLLNSNLSSDEETIELVDENQDLDDEITSDDLKDSNKLSSSSVSDSEEIIVSTEPITIDSSNYSIEKTTSISMGQGVKTLEVFSDYGEGVVLSGYNNKVYFILKDERDNPIKTYGSLTVGDRIKRDFVTDDAGMGSITLSASDVGALPSSTAIPTITFRQW